MNLEDKFREWFLGDEAAVGYAGCMWDAIQRWDDLEDEGKCEDHNELLEWLAVGKNWHPFHMRNPAAMDTAWQVMILSWRAANVLDHHPIGIEKSLMLRGAVYQVWHLMAWLVGGSQHATAVGPDIYLTYGETIADLREEMQCPLP